MNKKQDYASVSDMLSKLAPEFQDDFDDYTAQRLLVKHLAVVRSIKGMSQKDVSDRMGCTQSKVSKMENSTDAELNLGDVDKYADAIGVDLCFGLVSKNQTAYDRIKRHAFGIKRELQNLADFADGDDDSAKHIAEKHMETLINIVKIVSDSASTLPCPPRSKKPYLRIEMGLNADTCLLEEQSNREESLQ